MVLMAISGSFIAFRKYRQPPPPPPFPIPSNPSSKPSGVTTIRPNSKKTQNLLIPSVSILRPLCGLDYGLRENIESTFLQQWPLDRFEIIFCVADDNDPAIAVVKGLIAKYPAVHARLIIGGETVGVNPKINNLMEAYRTAEADLLWILDSNARVHITTLARAVSVLSPPSGPTNHKRTRIGLVHHVPAGILCQPDSKLNDGKKGWGCLLEACFLNGNHARQYLTLNALGVASCLMGKSNLFYRSDLERATRRRLSRTGHDHRQSLRSNRSGGEEQASLLSNSDGRYQSFSFDALEFFGQFLGEDNMIGQTLWDDGIRHATTIDVVGNVIGPLSVGEYLSRRIRWIRARKYMLIGATLVEPFTESILLGTLMTVSLERLNLTNGIPKKVLMMIHETIYFLLDYSVYRSMLCSPLISSSLQNPTKYQYSTSQLSSPAGPSPSTPIPSSSFTPASSSIPSTIPPNESSGSTSLTRERSDPIQVKLGSLEFLLGWLLRECSALMIWIVALSSDQVKWRKTGQTLRVLWDSRVAETS